MNEPERGMPVIGPGGALGTVEEIIRETAGGPPRVMVRRDNGENMVLQPGAYQVEGGNVRVGAGGSAFETQRMDTGATSQAMNADLSQTQPIGVAGSVQTLEVGDNQAMVIPVLREEVLVTKREIERGGVRVHKRVEEREEVVERPAFHEEVTVERVAIGRPVETAVGARQEGETLVIPVLEEMLVVEKRLVLKEEVRITKRRIDETEQARILLRQEHVDIENLGETLADGTASAAISGVEQAETSGTGRATI
jgi:uncharacterized protein (TIGR02271 family)